MQSKSPTSPAPIAPSCFTDSAYASASLMDNNNKNTNDRPAVHESLQGLDDPTIDDAATEYSDVPSTTFSRRQLYIQEPAKDLYNKISFQAVDLGQDHRVDISATLPRLLKAFALKIRYCATTQVHRDVMAFVHRHRRWLGLKTFNGSPNDLVDTSLREIACPTPVEVEPMDVIYPSQIEIERAEIQDDPRSMSLNERLALWEQSEGWEQPSIVEGLDNLELVEAEEEDEYEEADI
ncbi:nucleoside phosphorylase [Fusarium sp. NRRL 25303]|nr:nucleoside phosphorylase [Fusarium sp. NRRL 25303]